MNEIRTKDRIEEHEAQDLKRRALKLLKRCKERR